MAYIQVSNITSNGSPNERGNPNGIYELTSPDVYTYTDGSGNTFTISWIEDDGGYYQVWVFKLATPAPEVEVSIGYGGVSGDVFSVPYWSDVNWNVAGMSIVPYSPATPTPTQTPTPTSTPTPTATSEPMIGTRTRIEHLRLRLLGYI